MTDSSSERDPVEQLAEEFVERQRRGERPALAEYTERYPQYADAIRDLFSALALMEQLKPASSDDQTNPNMKANLAEARKLERLGDFRILREVGRGGMGIVYEAEQVSLGRHVALKVLPSHALLEPLHLQRFQREARSVARLHHTNIVPVYGVGEHDGLHYYVMQFIQGLGLNEVLAELKRLRLRQRVRELPTAAPQDGSAVDLAQSLLTGQFQLPSPSGSLPSGEVAKAPRADGPRSSVSDSSIHLPGQTTPSTLSDSSRQFWQSVARVGVQVANALAFAHGQGILHRDIKPSNLLLDSQGTVWITDFGLARADSEQDDLTVTGEVVGTVSYMAPERFSGRGDHRADIYSLGLTLYELLTLQPAFEDRDRHKLITKVLTEEPPRPRKLNHAVPLDLETIILKAIARDPDHRYQTAGDLAEDLKRFVDDKPIKARRISELEKLWRWSRRNPALATLTGVVLLLLVGIAVGSSIAAVWFRRVADDADQHRDHAVVAHHLEEEARLRAEEAQDQEKAARRKAEITLVDLQTSHGLIAAENNDPAQAMLWFANAARLARMDAQRQWANRVRVTTWSRRLTFPIRACAHDGQPLKTLEFQPGGAHLLTLTENQRCYVWDWAREQPLPWARGATPVSAVCWHPRGDWVALGLPSGVVEIRAVPSGELLYRPAHRGAITALACRADGGLLAVASDVVRLWDCQKHTFLPGEFPHPKPVHSLIFSPKGNRLATGCEDHNARIFSLEGKPATTTPLFAPVRHQSRSAGPPAFIAEGRGLVTGTSENQATWWDAATGARVRAFEFPQTGEIRHLTASPDGQTLALVGWDGALFFDIAQGRRGPHLRTRHWMPSCAFSPDSKLVLTVTEDRTAQLWSVTDGTPVEESLVHQSRVDLGAISSNNALLATAQSDGLVRVWRRPAPNSGDQRLPCPGGECLARLSPDGRHVLATRIKIFDWKFEPRRLVIFDVEQGKPAGLDLELDGSFRDAALSPDGRSVAVVTVTPAGGRLHLWDFRTGKPACSPLAMPSNPGSLAYLPDGSRLAVFCQGGEILIVDPIRGKELLRWQHEIKAHWGLAGFTVQFTGDGTTLVSFGPDRTVQVWDAATGRRRYPPIDPGQVTEVTLSRDGRFLASYGWHRNPLLQVWNLATGQRAAEPLVHPDGVLHACFGPDSGQLLTAGRDGKARWWDWRAGQLLCPPLKHDDEVYGVDVGPEGRWGLTVSRDKTARAWDLLTGKPLCPPIAVAGLNIVATPSGKRAVVGPRGPFPPLVGRNALLSIDLGDLATPDSMDLDDLCLLAELTSAQRIHEGAIVELSSAEWLKRWEEFRRRHPEYGVLSP